MSGDRQIVENIANMMLNKRRLDLSESGSEADRGLRSREIDVTEQAGKESRALTERGQNLEFVKSVAQLAQSGDRLGLDKLLGDSLIKLRKAQEGGVKQDIESSKKNVEYIQARIDDLEQTTEQSKEMFPITFSHAKVNKQIAENNKTLGDLSIKSTDPETIKATAKENLDLLKSKRSALDKETAREEGYYELNKEYKQLTNDYTSLRKQLAESGLLTEEYDRQLKVQTIAANNKRYDMMVMEAERLRKVIDREDDLQPINEALKKAELGIKRADASTALDLKNLEKTLRGAHIKYYEAETLLAKAKAKIAADKPMTAAEERARMKEAAIAEEGILGNPSDMTIAGTESEIFNTFSNKNYVYLPNPGKDDTVLRYTLPGGMTAADLTKIARKEKLTTRGALESLEKRAIEKGVGWRIKDNTSEIGQWYKW